MRAFTSGIPSIVNGLRKRRWSTAVPLARSAGTVVHAVAAPIGSNALRRVRVAAARAHALGAALRRLTILGCRRSQFSALKRRTGA